MSLRGGTTKQTRSMQMNATSLLRRAGSSQNPLAMTWWRNCARKSMQICFVQFGIAFPLANGSQWRY